MNAKYPDTDSQKTREGTAAHWCGSEMLAGRDAVHGQVTPEGYVVDQEMIDAAWLYCDDVDQVAGELHVEQVIPIPMIHPQNWGTPDAWRWDTHAMRLTVWDFKYGHDFVEVYENWQLIDYTAGILSAINGLDDQRITVDFRVVQPRSYHRDGPIRSWVVAASDLRGYFNQLHTAAALANKPDPVATVGDQCRYCPGRHACNAAQAAAYRAADIAIQGQPIDMTGPALGLELRNLKRAAKLLDARVSGLETEAQSRLARGERVNFFELVSEPGRKKWSLPAEVMAQVGDAFGVDIRKPLEVITPTQAAKLLPPEIIDLNSSRPPGAASLTQVNDLTARKIFGHN